MGKVKYSEKLLFFVKHLSFFFNCVEDRFLQLAAFLKTNNTIRTISLHSKRVRFLCLVCHNIFSFFSECELGEKGMKALANALETNTRLTIFSADTQKILCGWPNLDTEPTTPEHKKILLLITRNQRLHKIYRREHLLKRTRDVATAVCSLNMPIYVLFDIINWELALQMAEIELECVGENFISIEQYRQRCELMDGKYRVELIKKVYDEFATL